MTRQIAETLKTLRMIDEKEKLRDSATPEFFAKWQKRVLRILSVQFPHNSWAPHFESIRPHLVEAMAGVMRGTFKDTDEQIGTWEELEEWLLDMMAPELVSPGQRARARLYAGKIRQTASVARYYNVIKLEFGKVSRSTLTDSERLELFRTNLLPEVRRTAQFDDKGRPFPTLETLFKYLQLKEVTTQSTSKTHSEQGKMFRPASFTKFRQPMGKTTYPRTLNHVSWPDRHANADSAPATQMMEIDESEALCYSDGEPIDTPWSPHPSMKHSRRGGMGRGGRGYGRHARVVVGQCKSIGLLLARGAKLSVK